MGVNPFTCLRKISKMLCKGSTREIPLNIKEEKEEYKFDFDEAPDYYYCPDCNNIPEISRIHFDNGIVELKCQIHGVIKINVSQYFEKLKERPKHEGKCECKTNDIAKYCFECQKFFCLECEKNHSTKSQKKHTIVNIKEKDEKNENQAFKKDKDKVSKYNEDTLSKMIWFNQVFLNTCEKFPNNYYHIQSGNNLNKSLDSEISRNSAEFDKLLDDLKDKKKEEKKAIDELKPKLEGKDKKKIRLIGNRRKIALYEKNLDSKDFENISKIIFIKLKIMDISHNKIKIIEPLKNMYLQYLEVLDMSYNEIEDITPIEQLDCKELNELCLQKNQIKKFESLNKCEFPKLRILRIENNPVNKSEKSYKKVIKKYKGKINDIEMTIDSFNKKYNNYLTDLLDNNMDKIKSIRITGINKQNLGNEMVKDLYYLLSNYKNNNILDIMLDNNKISDISILSKIPLPNLEMLDLSLNKIKSLRFLKEMDISKFKILFLDNNEIFDLYQIRGFLFKTSEEEEEEEQEKKEEEKKKIIKILTFKDNKFDKNEKRKIEKIYYKEMLGEECFGWLDELKSKGTRIDLFGDEIKKDDKDNNSNNNNNNNNNNVFN